QASGARVADALCLGFEAGEFRRLRFGAVLGREPGLALALELSLGPDDLLAQALGGALGVLETAPLLAQRPRADRDGLRRRRGGGLGRRRGRGGDGANLVANGLGQVVRRAAPDVEREHRLRALEE